MFEAIKDRRMEGKTPLEQARLVQIYLLDVFDEICKANGLKYWLMYGTLLGAERHRGFIPWDDDIDVGMEMSDYRKFQKIAPRCLPKTILLQCPGRLCKGNVKFIKLRDVYSFYCESGTNVAEPCGIFLDIFPFENVPAYPRRFSMMLYKYLFGAQRHRILTLTRLRGSIICKELDLIASMGWWMLYQIGRLVWSLGRVVKSDVLGEVGAYQAVTFFERNWIFPLASCTFEGKQYPAPWNPDAVLTANFGDWRKLPPEEKRIWHASIIDATHAPVASWARKWVGPCDRSKN